MEEERLLFFINGTKVSVPNPDPEMTLLYFIRNHLHLTGSKLGCGEGGCGACTVMCSKYSIAEGVEHFAVNACLYPLCAVHGMAVTTVEGIGNTRDRLHPCQERIAKAHGSQCGFCTPGFVMSMYSLLRNNHTPSEEEIEETFQGNLCRCTGYRPILDGFKTFAPPPNGVCCGEGSSNCCKRKSGDDGNGKKMLFDSSKFSPLDPTQELIFPPELKLSVPPPSLVFKGPRAHWYRPSTLPQLLTLVQKFPHSNDRGKPKYRIVTGNTEIGVEVKLKGAFYEVLISPSVVPELNSLELTDAGLVVGGAVNLTRLAKELRMLVRTLPEYRTRVFSAVLEMLRWFAGQQIRNVSSLGGNVCNASPISDLNPLLMAAGAQINVTSLSGSRSVHINTAFFTGYKQTVLDSDEVLSSLLLPFTTEFEYFLGYKQARRREDDIAIVNAGFRVLFEPHLPQYIVKEISLCYGGMSYITVSASKTEKSLLGRVWDDTLLNEAVPMLMDEFPLPSDVPGGMPEYRRALVASFFFKFYWSVKSQLRGACVEPQLHSAILPFHRPVATSCQGFESVHSNEFCIGQPLMQLSAPLQASGEARYTDDIPRCEGELYAGLVMSTHAHAQISVDWSRSDALEGVHGHVTVNDLPGSNETGLFNDELVFADGEVTHFGQIIGMVLADNQMLAQRAAKLVQVEYIDKPSVITIEDAIAAKSFYPVVRKVGRGCFDSSYQDCALKLEGDVRVGGQDHFYLETHGCLVVPKGEGDEMEIYASTQCVDGTQRMAAKALAIPSNRVVARVKRIGGGFGGKESRSFLLSTATAVAAFKSKRPVRVILERDQDMIVSGGRHPFLGKYKVGFTKEGKLLCLDLCLYSNGGASIDLTYGVNERAVTHADNAYNIPNLQIKGIACRTNLPTNTAFRGFGGPQGMMIMEQIISRVANHLELPHEEVREMNMYEEGDSTPYGKVLSNCNIQRCWKELKESSNFIERKLSIEKFNKENRWKKRGLSLVPTKFGISFGVTFMNQGGALLQVYTDGSVLLSHGGMEMGQGLHTKMVQVCSCLLGIAPDKVHILETNSSVVPNASPSAASYSTDLYGMAVKDCCEQILCRLAPVKERYPDSSWEAWIKTAYLERINLSAQGFYATPDLNMDWETGKGNIFNYFAYGASCSEVEVDCLTGDFTVLRTDIIEDVGDSLNPAIDIGQVEGAFVQGLGLFTMEQCVYLEGSGRGAERGQLFTTGPGTYKIPSCQDIPVDFRVGLLGRAPNPKAIFSSKAVGEPPLFLAASVFFAIQEAVSSSCQEVGEKYSYSMDSPATCERIRMACSDHITKQLSSNATDKRWTIEA